MSNYNNTNKLYYKLRDGQYAARYQIESAYYICSGKCALPDDSDFLRWLHSKLGNSIIEVKRANQFSLGELATMPRVTAIRICRDACGCTLAEAREQIDWIRKDLGVETPGSESEGNEFPSDTSVEDAQLSVRSTVGSDSEQG